jgi:hypothetical protein
MTGDTAVDVPIVDNKVEEVVKSDKEVIAEEENELIENEKTDEPEKSEESKEDVTEPKKLNLIQKLFGKRKDFVVPKIDEVAKTDKEIIVEEEKAEKTDNTENTEKTDEEKKEEPQKVQNRLKKIFSMKKTKRDDADKAEGEEKIVEGDEKTEGGEEKDGDKKAEEKKDGEETIEEVAEVDMSKTTAEKKTLMQKLMTIKRDLMANKKEDKVEEEKKEDDKVEEEEQKEEEKAEDEEKKEGEDEVKVDNEETKEDETKDELGNDKPKPGNRIKKFFSMKRQRKTTDTEEKVEAVEEKNEETEAGTSEEKKDDEETEGAEKIEKAEKLNLLQRLFGRKAKVEEENAEKKDDEKVEEDKEDTETEKKDEATEEKIEEVDEKVEDVVEQIMRLHLVNRTPTIPSISPMQLKLESWLKFHDVKYENTHDKDNLPASAYQPMQSNDYLVQLANTHNKQMPMDLDADQKSVQHAMIALAEKNIHFAILNWQCSNVDNIIKGYKINLHTYLNSKVPLSLLRLFFKNNFCKSGLKLVKSNGFAQNSTEEIEKHAMDDLKVLAEMLGDNDFFFGSSASMLDLVVFSHLVQITVVDETVACNLRDQIKTEHSNLVALVDRMKTLTWGDDWTAATELLELNPHIPKPVVEEVKEIVLEVVEKATEEKVLEVPEVKVEEVEDDKVEEVTEKKSDEAVDAIAE